MKTGQESVLKTAVAILLAGFVFAFFALPFAGIDLLIDAVGFLLVFNGANALKKLARSGDSGADGGFGVAAALSIGLVAVAAVQLFLSAGTPAAVLLLLRSVLEVGLFFFLWRGFSALLDAWQRPGTAVAATVALWVSLAVALMRLIQSVLRLSGAEGRLPPLVAVVIEGSGYLSSVLLLVTFLVAFKLYKRSA